jgi:hypothetical protein
MAEDLPLMLRFLLVYGIPLILAIYALVDCIQTPAHEVRYLPKLGWIAVIVLIGLIGPVAWLVAGRQRDARAAGPPASWGGIPRPPRRAVAPDDDPDFLRSLGRGTPPRRERRSLDPDLEAWERDLSGDDRTETGGDGPEDGEAGPGDPSGSPR